MKPIGGIPVILKFMNMTREEKRQARIERYERLAEKAKQESTEAHERSHRLVEHIPAGQPILPGRRGITHRNTLEKSWNALGKSVKLDEKAEYYKSKAEAAAKNDNIYLGDEDAVERLTEKLEGLKRSQEIMKFVNKIVRDKKKTREEKIKAIQENGLSENQAEKILTSGYVGFASYSLTNNNAKIHRVEDQLKRAIALRETETTEETINGIRVVRNTEENRLQLFFPDKPDKETRSKLRHNGFRFAYSNECWQSYLNNRQIYRAKELLK